MFRSTTLLAVLGGTILIQYGCVKFNLLNLCHNSTISPPRKALTKIDDFTTKDGTPISSAPIGKQEMSVRQKHQDLTGELPDCVNADCDCSDFTTQKEAQTVLDAFSNDPHKLDKNHDGVACENLPKISH